jgi:hypothetical protein
MRRGVWWGTWPLVTGAAGLFLLAFGAGAMRTEEEERERQLLLKVREWQAARDRAAEDEPEPPRRGRRPADAPAPAKPDPDAVRDERDPAAVVAGRVAFYAGLALLVTAGVILFRFAPARDRPDWGEGG